MRMGKEDVKMKKQPEAASMRTEISGLSTLMHKAKKSKPFLPFLSKQG